MDHLRDRSAALRRAVGLFDEMLRENDRLDEIPGPVWARYCDDLERSSDDLLQALEDVRRGAPNATY